MRYSKVTIAVAIAVLAWAGIGGAQMHGQMHNMGAKAQADTTRTKDQGNMMGMMHNMNQQCQMMAGDFDSLEQHFDRMMKMDDMGELKAEMQKHREMMASMHRNMAEQQQTCDQMMSMMHGGSMMGGMMGGGMSGSMTGKTSGESQTGGGHDHNH